MGKAIMTFDDFDKFGLKEFADQLTLYLEVESKFVEGSFVLSLNSEFGSGKTTFLEMWKNDLEGKEDPPHIVLLNAWESDFQGDALLAIVSGLISGLRLDEEKKADQLKETTGKLGKFALSIGNDVVKKFTGIDAIKAGERAESTEAVGIGHACFEVYRERQKLFDELKVLLTKLAEDSDKHIIVIVDELDRCRPDYAVEFLETIKHFFDIQGFSFVLGVDKHHLASSVKSMFGQDLKFEEYYRKYAHRNVSLPVHVVSKQDKFCSKMMIEYFSPNAFAVKSKSSFAEFDRSMATVGMELYKGLPLNARQLHEFARVVTHAIAVAHDSNSGRMMWGFKYGTLFLVGLSMVDEGMYHRLGKGHLPIGEMTNWLEEKNLGNADGKRRRFWWASLIFLGAYCNVGNEVLMTEFKALGSWSEDDGDQEAFDQKLQEYRKAYDSFGDM
ncbi:hypothetical protein PDESU_05305 [Pontiella desulfatans]|uniref:KAP NTPase domain-containing protein n=1 Tax=Pontiella desulfatans TaxID=2750659 RepID=A0A6C2UBH8_PONDE|nr:P-loop NTPase fold protein [Pontiella desulfatans]VGO16714.1 hypothetical protein PDESU_05305 [Pontiella desulfatans]